MAPRTVAITGLATFVGRRLTERLRESHPNLQLVGVDRRKPYSLDLSVRYHEVDLTDPTADSRLAEAFEKEGVEAVVHAAFRRTPTPDLETDHELETIGSLHVLNACAATRVRRVVLASTSMLYGPWPDNPNFLTEEHPLRGHPRAHCINNRVEVEEIVARWSARHPEAEVTVLRPCWVMGPRHVDSVVSYFEPPVVPTLLGYDPLLQFVHEEDCLRVFEQAVMESHPGVFNVVGRGVLPLSTVLRTAGKRALPVPAAILYRLRAIPSQAQTGDPPEAFFDYLRYLWTAAGEKGWDAFGEPLYSTREAWASFVSSRRMRRYR